MQVDWFVFASVRIPFHLFFPSAGNTATVPDVSNNGRVDPLGQGEGDVAGGGDGEVRELSVA